MDRLRSDDIDSIIDAIHITPFIASASYFCPLMGGLSWKRAAGPGALEALVVGAGAQISQVAVDLVNNAPLAPPYLETLHPILRGQGGIVGMLLSAVDFVSVSLATRPSEEVVRQELYAASAEVAANYKSPNIFTRVILTNQFYPGIYGPSPLRGISRDGPTRDKKLYRV